MEYITQTDRIYAEDDNGKLLAEITFPIRDGVATINHTFVDDSLRGLGIASQLMQKAIEKIAAEGLKLNATCTYAVAWLKRHPDSRGI